MERGRITGRGAWRWVYVPRAPANSRATKGGAPYPPSQQWRNGCTDASSVDATPAAPLSRSRSRRRRHLLLISLLRTRMIEQGWSHLANRRHQATFPPSVPRMRTVSFSRGVRFSVLAEKSHVLQLTRETKTHVLQISNIMCKNNMHVETIPYLLQ